MEQDEIVMPYPCCEHCRHPRHPQFTGHPSPCWHCQVLKLTQYLAQGGTVEEWNRTQEPDNL